MNKKIHMKIWRRKNMWFGKIDLVRINKGKPYSNPSSNYWGEGVEGVEGVVGNIPNLFMMKGRSIILSISSLQFMIYVLLAIDQSVNLNLLNILIFSPSVYPCVFPSVRLFVSLSVSVSVCYYVCLFVYLSFYLSLCPFICLFDY